MPKASGERGPRPEGGANSEITYSYVLFKGRMRMADRYGGQAKDGGSQRQLSAIRDLALFSSCAGD
jgi:hypothetical protein